jgi:hypothetical protein
MWKAIINWINSKSYRCEHNWEELRVIDVYHDVYSNGPYETKWVYRCTKCCNSKIIKV